MKQRLATGLLVSLLAVTGFTAPALVHAAASVDAAASVSAVATQADDPARMILVMLHLPAQHYRPSAGYGSTYVDRAGHGARARIASDLAKQHGLSLVSDWPMPDIGVDCYVMRVPPDLAVADVVLQLSQDRRADWVQPMNVFHGMDNHGAAPIDSTPRSDSLVALQPSAKLWHLEELHKTSTGSGVSIAIIDSGVDQWHPDLQGRIAVSENFVDAGGVVAESHGTAVAGIIGARADRGARIVGIAPQARLIALRACWEASPKQTLCSSFTLAKALQFALADKAQVINMSLAGPEDRLLARLLDVALERNATVVGAVDSQLPGGGFPASHPGVLAVSDTSSNASASTSDFNAKSNRSVLFAPGDDVPTTAPGASWSFVSGSSFAAAHVSGMVALVRQVAPSMTMRPSLIWARLPADSSSGPAGFVDACNTLRQAAPAFSCTTTTDQTPRSP